MNGQRLSSSVLAGLALLALGSRMGQAQWSVLQGDPRARDEKPPRHLFQEFTPAEWNAGACAPPERIEWFRSLRFGVLIQAGLARGQEISWGGCATRKPPDTGSGPIPDGVWQSWPKEMRLENFEAKKWVAAGPAQGDCRRLP